MNPLIPPGARADRLDTPTGRLRVLSAGPETRDRPPLLLVHGGGSDNAAISWHGLMGPLAERRTVLAPDLPGFGGSMDVPPVGGADALADVVAEVMDSLELTRAIVGGVSMGGDVALNLALRHPDRVAGLVLIAPGGLIPLFRNRATHFWAWAGTRVPDPLLLPLVRLSGRFTRSAVRAVVKDPGTLPGPVIDEFVRESRRPGGGLAYTRYNQASIGRHRMLNDLSERVAEISAPTLLLHGEDDPIVDPAGSRRAAERMPDARLVEIPDCGHWAQSERHDLVLERILDFLERVDPSPAP
ncbi:alpha/beta fold hydrolase [Nocardiopsis alba]|uniref:alpha/beta fold hydrolase n=1 Tax=Nocardiopsis alba TaxID=53437 RepID=UPI0033A14B57